MRKSSFWYVRLILLCLRDVVWEKHSKKWWTNSWFLLHDNAPAHRSVLVKGFWAKTMWQHWSILMLPWFLPVFSTKFSIRRAVLLWCYWYNEECDGRAEKAFTKLLPLIFLTIYTKVYICTRGLFWNKCALNNFAILYLSEIKRFRKKFGTTT